MSGCCLFSSLLRCSHAWSMVLASVLQHLQLLYLGSSAHGWDQHHLLSPRLWLGDHLLCTLLFSPSMEHIPTVCLGTYMCGGSPKPGIGHRRWRLVDWAFSHPKYFIFLITTTPYKNKKQCEAASSQNSRWEAGPRCLLLLNILIQNTILELLLPF